MIRQVNEELAKSYVWVNANKLSLNIDKTNFMLFMPNYSSHCADHIVINQTRIHKVKETKVSWRYHRQQAQVVCTYQVRQQKNAKGIDIILKSRKVFSNEALLSLYHTFVYPYLSYCIHVWGKAYNIHLNDLIVLQNKTMRIINGVPPRTEQIWTSFI